MNTITKKLEKALTLANELFQDRQEWQSLTDEQKLRFAYALMVANREMKARQLKP